MSVNVYMIVCAANGKRYIGITKRDVDRRWKVHCHHALKETRAYRLHAAIRKYGPEAFAVMILETVDSWAKACERERAYIEGYRTFEHGYNSTLGGEGTVGHKPTAETLAKRSAKLKGIARTPEWKAKISASRSGQKLRKKTPEERAKMSEIRKGKSCPDERKNKIRASIAAWWAAKKEANPEKYHPKPPRKLPERTIEQRQRYREATLKYYQSKRSA